MMDILVAIIRLIIGKIKLLKVNPYICARNKITGGRIVNKFRIPDSMLRHIVWPVDYRYCNGGRVEVWVYVDQFYEKYFFQVVQYMKGSRSFGIYSTNSDNICYIGEVIPIDRKTYLTHLRGGYEDKLMGDDAIVWKRDERGVPCANV